VPQRSWPEPDGLALAAAAGRSPTLATLRWAVGSISKKSAEGAPRVPAASIKNRLASFALTTAGGALLLAALARSDARLQILFALFVGFGLAALAAHQWFPTACGAVYWTAPIVVGLAVYALGALTTGSLASQPTAWLETPRLARTLPVDWLAAGGGAMIGMIISARLHEARTLEAMDIEA